VSRALAAALVAILTTALTLAPGALPSGSADRAAAADCSWQRHTKRIVKQLRREGKLRRVVRRRHWWSCDALPAPAALGAPPVVAPSPAPPAPPAAPEPESEPNRVSVKALEYSFTLSRPSVSAGAVTVELNNQGEDPHNLQLEAAGGGGAPLEIAETDPRQNRTASFELEAGSYRLWCSLESHDDWGMNATLVVAGG
jgi:plastocyanin